MAPKARLLQLFRKVHLYFGLFISPALLFFAFTGAYQTLGYHEASANYKPPAVLAVLGQIHKKQTSVVPVRRGPVAPASGGEARTGTPRTAAEAPDHARPKPDHHRSDPSSPEAPTLKASDQVAPPLPGSGPAESPQSPRTGASQGEPGRPGGQAPLTLQAKQKQHLPLKIFFVLVSVGLFTSTLTGIYMAYEYDRNRLLVTGLLLAGLLLPLLLLRF